MKHTSKKTKLITAIIASVAIIGAGVGIVLATQPKNGASSDSSIDSSSTQAHTHEYTTTVTNPTCTQAGYTTHKCDCGDEYVDSYVNATNHNFKTYVYDNNATCLANGTETATCGNKNCSQKNTRVKANSITTHNVEDSGWCSICDQAIAPTKGILYDVSADGTYAEVIGYEGNSAKVNIATTYNNLPVKAIADSAFKNTKIENVIIPNSIIAIDKYAFCQCDNLSNIVIPNSITSIEFSAFYSCDTLNTIAIPDSVTFIGKLAFGYCSNLTSVTLGNGIISIASTSFADCNVFNVYKNCKYLGNDNNPYLALMETNAQNFSTYEIHNETKVIADYAFNELTNLTNIIIPDSVIHIGVCAFSYCLNLTDITIGKSVTTINDFAFWHCNSLTKIIIPNSTMTIGRYSFNECTNLADLTIGNSVISIGDGAFQACDKLTNITIPNSVTFISIFAFACDSLSNVFFENTSNWIAIYHDGSRTIPLQTLSSPTTSAEYLKSIYNNYTWQRTE